ncbi:CLUMA_CG005082, isoform A, partial [Clunio marinus]
YQSLPICLHSEQTEFSFSYKTKKIQKLISKFSTNMNSWLQMNANSNGEEAEVNDTDESNQEIGQQINYKQQYLQLKKKLKLLLFENEFFQENLRQNQKRLLKVSKDRSFLLDRLLKYEPTESTESEGTETSDDETKVGGKKRKTDSGSTLGRKKKVIIKKQPNLNNINSQAETDDVAMVERHLEARNSISMPSFTFPQEIFDEVDDI